MLALTSFPGEREFRTRETLIDRLKDKGRVMPSRRSASGSNRTRHESDGGGNNQEEEGDDELGEQHHGGRSSEKSDDDDEDESVPDERERKRKVNNIKKGKARWSAADDEALLKAVIEDRQNREAEGQDDEEEDWDEIAQSLPGKTPVQCLKRYMLLNQSGGDDDEDDDDDDSAPTPKKARRSKGKPKEEPLDPANWSMDDIELLKKLVEQYKDTAPRWNEVAGNFPLRTAIDCLTKWQSLSAAPVIKGKGSWTAEEDNILREKRALYGRKWAKIAAHLPGRQGKQCRERFVNHLDPELKKGEWTDDEEAILIALHQQFGNRWANISKQLPGRSDNDVKNHWYSTIQRKFQQHGKDKLVQAALQQVQLMQQMGTLPMQNPNPTPAWPAPTYNQGPPPQHHPPPPYPHHPMHTAPPYQHPPPAAPPSYYPPPPAGAPVPPPDPHYMYPPPHHQQPYPPHPHHHPGYGYHPHYQQPQQPRHPSSSPSLQQQQMQRGGSGEGLSPSSGGRGKGSSSHLETGEDSSSQHHQQHHHHYPKFYPPPSRRDSSPSPTAAGQTPG